MAIAQTDRLCLLKLAPSNLAAYVLYSRSCLQFQQFKAAYVFSSKGITVAEKLNDDAHLAQLLLINATSAALGGSSTEGQFSFTSAVKSYQAANEARDKCFQWLPSDNFRELLELEPELSIIGIKVIAASNQAGTQVEVEGEGEIFLPCLKSHYATKEPSSVPPGAVEEDGEGGVRLRPTGFDVEEGEGGGGQGPAPVPAPAPAAANGGQAKKSLGKGQRTQRKK